MNTTIQLHKLYASGMVLQRNATCAIWGKALSDAAITVAFCGTEYGARANTSGEWQLEFSTGDAGGPYVLTVRADNGDEVTLHDVYIGEVWVCSGQSNMQLPMNRLAYAYPEESAAPPNDNIRVFTVPIRAGFDGEMRDLAGGEWCRASAETLPEISGTSYFFAKKLSELLGVPVGIINASQGGSPIESWMNRASLAGAASADVASKADVLTEKIWNQAIEGQKLIDVWQQTAVNRDRGTGEKWHETPFVPEHTITVPSVFPPFENGQAGTYWIQKTITLTAEQAAICNEQKTHIWFGVIVDADRMWINGTEVGSTPYMYPPRRYVVPKGVLRAGENRIAIQVLCNGFARAECVAEKPYVLFTDDFLTEDWHNVMRGAISRAASGCGAQVSTVGATRGCGTAGAPQNALIDGVVHDASCGGALQKQSVVAVPKNPSGGGVWIDLTGEWELAKGCELEKMPPQFFPEWQSEALYNGMLSPLFNYTVRGVAWYQGESNTGSPREYATLLQNMIALWRSKFTRYPCGGECGPMPFLIAQLPNFGEKTACAPDAGWALLRESEDTVARTVENVGLSVLIDSGEWNDLHPEDKKTVGTRLSFEAMRICYGEASAPTAPRLLRHARATDAIDVTFSLTKGDSLVWVCDEAATRDGVPTQHDVISCNDASANGQESALSVQEPCEHCSEKAVCKESAVKIADQSGFYALYACADGTERIVGVCAKITDTCTVRVLLPTDIQGTCKKLFYAWADNPARVTLYSSSLLPAAPFVLMLGE